MSVALQRCSQTARHARYLHAVARAEYKDCLDEHFSQDPPKDPMVLTNAPLRAADLLSKEALRLRTDDVVVSRRLKRLMHVLTYRSQMLLLVAIWIWKSFC